MAEQRQRFVGNIECQLGLTRGAGLFFPFDTLHQQDNKADAHAAEDHRNTDFRNNIQPKSGRGCPHHNQNHGQGFTHHARDDPGAPVLLFGEFAVNPAGQDPGDNAGYKARNSRHAADINQIAVCAGNQSGDHPNPGAKQYPT